MRTCFQISCFVSLTPVRGACRFPERLCMFLETVCRLFRFTNARSWRARLSREDMQIVPQVLQAVLALPDSTHVALRYTSILLVGQLSEWIEKHPQLLGESSCRVLGESSCRLYHRPIMVQLQCLEMVLGIEVHDCKN